MALRAPTSKEAHGDTLRTRPVEIRPTVGYSSFRVCSPLVGYEHQRSSERPGANPVFRISEPVGRSATSHPPSLAVLSRALVRAQLASASPRPLGRSLRVWREAGSPASPTPWCRRRGRLARVGVGGSWAVRCKNAPGRDRFRGRELGRDGPSHRRFRDGP